MTTQPNKRIDLDDAIAGRTTLDAHWSSRKKTSVTVAAVGIAVVVVGASVWFTLANQPPRLPRSVDEALMVLASAKFDHLDEERQRQYQAEASRLVRALSPEERRAMMEEAANREAMRRLWQERFDDIARRFARGEENPFRRARDGNGQRGNRPEGRFDRENRTDENRQNRLEQFRDTMNERIASDAQTGNAQDEGLRAEMMKRRTAQRSANGGSGRGRRGG